MGLRAFTRDGVFRAGFGYSGTFYNVTCRANHRAKYKISGFNAYLDSAKTTLFFTLNQTVFEHPWLVSDPKRCLEWTQGRNQLFWQKALNELAPTYYPFDGARTWLYLSYVHESYMGYPPQTWFLSYSVTVAIVILASKQGNPYSPPRSGYTLSNRCTGDLIVTNA